jgi:hypothetical protein
MPHASQTHPPSRQANCHLYRKLFCWFTSAVKTTLELPDALVRRLKIRAVQEGRPLKRLVAELLDRGLDAAPAGAVATMDVPGEMTVNERGLPVFHCDPLAEASNLTTEQLLALERQALDQEDARRAGISG